MTDKYLPASQPVVGAPRDEREAFEQWRRRTAKTANPDTAVALHGFGDDAQYDVPATRAMWTAWQARAALSAAPVAPEPMADECAHTELGSRAYKAAYDAGYRARAVEAAEAASQPAERLRAALTGLVENSTSADWPDDLWNAAVLALAGTPAPTQAGGEVGLRAAASAVLAMCDAIGDFRNGVTDPTGTIDEGAVRAGELLRDLRTALAAPTQAPEQASQCAEVPSEPMDPKAAHARATAQGYLYAYEDFCAGYVTACVQMSSPPEQASPEVAEEGTES